MALITHCCAAILSAVGVSPGAAGLPEHLNILLLSLFLFSNDSDSSHPVTDMWLIYCYVFFCLSHSLHDIRLEYTLPFVCGQSYHFHIAVQCMSILRRDMCVCGGGGGGVNGY